MPISPPPLDTRKFADLVAEALARIPVHNPEWTNFNKSDPGVTIIEVAAFLLENDIFVANQIPERNRKKFLQLLGVPLQPASSARGLIQFTNERGPLATLTINEGMEVRAGQVPFRTERGLDVLPIEAAVYYKRAVDRPESVEHYNFLYASQLGQPPATPVSLYETTLLPEGGIDPGDAIDESLWIALLVRPAEKSTVPPRPPAGPFDEGIRQARLELAGRTLSLGVVPAPSDQGRRLAPRGAPGADAAAQLRVLLPKLPPGGKLPDQPAARQPSYQLLPNRSVTDVTSEPGTVEISLPTSPAELELWQNLAPLESGVGDFPPAIDDTEQAERLITWLRVRAPVKLAWVGINVSPVTQLARVSGEALPDGNGEPDQALKLARAPVVPGTVQMVVTPNLPDAPPERWQEIDDLLAAGPEVPAPDPRLPPGAVQAPNPLVKVFAVDAEAGLVRFGDGARGARPPRGARIRADYAYGVGAAGNLGAGAIDTSPGLPSGWKAQNPVPTWGGADAESVGEGEKQVPRYLQHHDRLVTADDFESIALRTPGVDVGRVDVLPAFHPDLSPSLPGDVAGVVTLMLLPASDPVHPDAPQPDDRFLRAVCDWLEPRRLVTTELLLRGPIYVPIQVAVAIEVVPGIAPAEVRDAVKGALLAFLSPLPPPGTLLLDAGAAVLTNPQATTTDRGWPLGKSVVALELQAVASRARGVRFVHPINLYRVTLPTATGGDKTLELLDPAELPLNGLELPQVLALEVAVGSEPPEFADTGTVAPSSYVPVPVVPEECQ
jgi:hypothetical protein